MKYLILLTLLIGNAYGKENKSKFWKKFCAEVFPAPSDTPVSSVSTTEVTAIYGDASIIPSLTALKLSPKDSTSTPTSISPKPWDERVKEEGNPGNLAEERTFKYTKSNFRAEELYISQEIGDLLTLSYGVQKVVWGQFEPYSPTNLVFPFNLSTTDVEFNKVKGTLSQQAGIATIYPTDNITLSLYAFPELVYDNVIKNRFDNPGTYRDANNNEVTRSVRLPKGSDELQTGARLMFYPSWGTIGLSYHKGYNTTQPSNNDSIVRAVSAPDDSTEE